MANLFTSTIPASRSSLINDTAEDAVDPGSADDPAQSEIVERISKASAGTTGIPTGILPRGRGTRGSVSYENKTF